MKRFFALMLLVLTVLMLFSCSTEPLLLDTLQIPEEYENIIPEKEAESKDAVFERSGFSTGYARVKITPTFSVPLGGFYNEEARYSEKVMDDLYVTCVAISDGDKIALFFSYDNLNTPEYLWEQVASLVEKDLGIPRELVWVTSTHTHYSPAFGSSNNAAIIRHLSQVYPAFRQCAKRAVETLDKSEIYIGSTETQGLNFVRRYVSVLDGSWVGGNNTPNNSDPAKVRHESIADPEMQIIKFDRKNAKDIVMVNWQSHYTGNGLTTYDISASWVAGFRQKAEKELGIDFAFYLGAAGDVITSSKLKGENSGLNYMKHGHALADTMIAAMPSLKKIAPGKIEGTIKEEEIWYNKDLEGFDPEIAKRISSLYANDSAAAEKLADQYGFDNAYHAIGIANRANKTKDTNTIQICAIRIGSLGFASAPYEMFHKNGSQVKDGSPYEMTFMCAYTNGSYGYIPTLEAFPNGGYEVNACVYIPGTGEQVADSLIALLKTLQD